MNNLLIAALAYFFGPNVIDGYNAARRQVKRLATAVLALTVLGVVANYVGTTYMIAWIRQLNLVVGCLFAILSAYAMACPAVIAALLVSGYSRNNANPLEGAESTVRDLGKATAWYFLGLSFFFLVLGTFPIARNWMGIFAIYLAVFTLILAGPTLHTRVLFARPIIFGYSVIVIALTVGSMVHGAAYKKAVGFDPYAYFRLSSIDMKADDIAKIEAANEEEVVLARLRIIERKVKRGESLTQDEEDLLKQINRNNVPGKAVDTAVAGWGLTTEAASTVYDIAASGVERISTMVESKTTAAVVEPVATDLAGLQKDLEKFINDHNWEVVNTGTIVFDKAGIVSTTKKGEMIMAKSGDRVIYAPTVKCKAGGYEIVGGKVTDCHVPKGSDGSELSGAVNIEGLGQSGQILVVVQHPRS